MHIPTDNGYEISQRETLLNMQQRLTGLGGPEAFMFETSNGGSAPRWAVFHGGVGSDMHPERRIHIGDADKAVAYMRDLIANAESTNREITREAARR